MPAVHVQSHGAVCVVQIDRPERRNAIDMPMFSALADALDEAQRAADTGAVFLHGSGAGFTAGHDLRAFDAWPQGPGDPVPRFLHALADLRKPLVIAVHGFAVGIGATCLLHADWVLAATDATLRFPFVDLGIAPEAGSSLLLPRTVGSLRARQLLLSGEALSAQKALDWGLVTEVCALPELVDRGMARAEQLASKSPAICGRIKDWLAPREALHARIDEEIDAINASILARRAG